jgi:hypothetical protein
MLTAVTTRNSVAERFKARVALQDLESRRLLTWAGLGLLLIYLLCVCVPYHFQGYATMPVTYEAAHNPTGLPSFPPVGLFSYLLSMPLIGTFWLTFCAALTLLGKVSRNKFLNTGLRLACIAIFVFLLLHLRAYDRVGLILDT